MNISPAHHLDFYKTGHAPQFPDNTDLVVSNLTPRGSRLRGIDKMIFFGLQYYVIEYLIRQWNENFFQQPEDVVIGKYKRRMDAALGKDAVDIKYIKSLHQLGYLPLEIWALPEGAVVPMRVPCLQTWNTKSEFWWLTNYLETIMNCVIWGMCNSATIAAEYRRILNHYADETVGNRSFVQWQGHDFSMRGMMGFEAAVLSGAGHLLSFTGTDIVPAIDFLEQYYNADAENEIIGGSIPASEHAVMAMGMQDGEFETFKRFLTKIYPSGSVSIVSDTWDFWQVITDFAVRLKSVIMSRSGKTVFRPDSGDPVKILTGYKLYQYDDNTWKYDDSAVGESVYVKGKFYQIKYVGGDEVRNYYDEKKELSFAEVKGAVECLWETFGGTITDKGYKLLDEHVGLIYGDSITIERCEKICARLKEKKFASFNVVFGIGSYTYQYNTRDSLGIAMKATYGQVNGVGREIFKKPKTDDGTKNSARGLLAVFKNEAGEYFLKERATWDEVKNCEFKCVFKDGNLLVNHTLSEIRARVSGVHDVKKNTACLA